MSLLRLSYYGLSVLTWIVTLLCGVAIHFVLVVDMPFNVKALSASLLFLIALLVFANDQDKMRLKETVRK
jgi:hypothetical protein